MKTIISISNGAINIRTTVNNAAYYFMLYELVPGEQKEKPLKSIHIFRSFRVFYFVSFAHFFFWCVIPFFCCCCCILIANL